MLWVAKVTALIDSIIPISSLIFHPTNVTKHLKFQIVRLEGFCPSRACDRLDAIRIRLGA